MNEITRVTWASSIVYGVAILISIFTGGLVWVLIVGAVLLGLVNTLGRSAMREPGAGRQRNRNRNRNRNRG